MATSATAINNCAPSTAIVPISVLTPADTYISGTPAVEPTLTTGIADAFGGTTAVRLTATASTAYSAFRVTIPAVVVPAYNQTPYSLSFWCKLVSGTPSKLFAYFSNYTELAISYQNELITGQWVKVTVSGIPATTVSASANLIYLYNNNETVTLDFCEVHLDQYQLIIPASTGIVEAVPSAGLRFDINVLSGNKRVPVLPGEKIEAYCYLNTHRCSARTVLKYYDSLGFEIVGAENTSSNLVTSASEITSISSMLRSGIITTVPATAATCLFVIRGYTITDTAEPYVFFARTYLGRAKGNQTGYSPWNSGSGIKQLTAENMSTYIQAASIGTAFIADAAIENAKIGNIIQSNNFVTGVSGWQINKSGNAELNTGTFRGSVNVGAYTGYAWPPAGTSGCHLSSLGFLAGNANGGGKYFQIYTPPNGNASISTNIPAYLADAQVTTLKLAGNAVTVPQIYTGTNVSYIRYSPITILSVNIPVEGGGYIGVLCFTAQPANNGVDAMGSTTVTCSDGNTQTSIFGVRTSSGDSRYRIPVVAVIGGGGTGAAFLNITASVVAIHNTGSAVNPVQVSNVRFIVMSGKK